MQLTEAWTTKWWTTNIVWGNPNIYLYSALTLIWNSRSVGGTVMKQTFSLPSRVSLILKLSPMWHFSVKVSINNEYVLISDSRQNCTLLKSIISGNMIWLCSFIHKWLFNDQESIWNVHCSSCSVFQGNHSKRTDLCWQHAVLISPSSSATPHSMASWLWYWRAPTTRTSRYCSSSCTRGSPIFTRTGLRASSELRRSYR